jgi:hypothetical protein
MSGPGGYGGEMPEFPFPRRAGDRPVPGVALDRLLDGDFATERATPDVKALADLLSSAAGPPSDRELADQTAAIAAFVRERHVGRHRRPATATGRRSMLTTLLSTKLAAAAAAGALGFGGLAAAAYTGALPEPIQDFAHQTVGAPAAASDHADPSGQSTAHDNSQASEQANAGQSGQPVGPDATGAARLGLCTAFAEEKAENGEVDTRSVAYRALVEAAGGAHNIDEFCAGVAAPGEGSGSASVPSSDAASEHATGAPTDMPSQAQTPRHPTGKPTELPSH